MQRLLEKGLSQKSRFHLKFSAVKDNLKCIYQFLMLVWVDLTKKSTCKTNHIFLHSVLILMTMLLVQK